MTPFSNDDLKIFITAIFDRYSLGKIDITEGSIKQHERCIAFEGKGERMRKTHYFAIPYHSQTWGVLTPKSILHNTDRADLSWMVNGQALGKADTLIHIGSHSDQSTWLHASKEMLKAWTHQRLADVPAEKQDAFKAHYDMNYEACIATGQFADEVSIGHFVESADSDYLKLKLQPISSACFSFDKQETSEPANGL